MRRRRNVLLIASVVVALVSSAAAGSASAPGDDPTSTTDPEVVTFGVQPARGDALDGRPFFSFGATPGASLDDTAAILNYSDQPLVLSVYATDAINTETGGFGLLPGADAPVEAGSWITLDLPNGTVEVPPRQGDQIGQVLVPFSVTIPTNAEPGDHAAGVVAVLTTIGQDEDGANVNLDQRVGSRVFVRVAGEIRPELVVSNLRTEYSSGLNPFGGSTATVRYTVTNEGNAKLAARQDVRVSGLLGGSWSAPDLEDVPLLLPGGSVDLVAEVPGVQPRVRLTTDVTLIPLRLEGDENGPMPDVTASQGFWAVPWLLVGLLLLLIAAVAAWPVWRRRRRRSRPVGGARHARGSERVPSTVP